MRIFFGNFIVSAIVDAARLTRQAAILMHTITRLTAVSQPIHMGVKSACTILFLIIGASFEMNSAEAGSITQTLDLGTWNTPNWIESSYHAANTAVNQFDPSLGTLNSVDISLTESASLKDPSFNSYYGSSALGIPLILLFTSSITIADLPGFTSYLGVNSNGSSGPMYAPPGTANYPDVIGTPSTVSVSITNPADVNAYVAVTPYAQLFLYETRGFHFSYAGSQWDDLVGGQFLTSGSVTYTYNYTSPHAVPEPSTFALLGLGGIGIAIRARSRRRATAA